MKHREPEHRFEWVKLSSIWVAKEPKDAQNGEGKGAGKRLRDIEIIYYPGFTLHSPAATQALQLS